MHLTPLFAPKMMQESQELSAQDREICFYFWDRIHGTYLWYLDPWSVYAGYLASDSFLLAMKDDHL